MLELIKVNKYYNRHKKNEIHVIDETNISIPSTGLVALLGPSGSGKTTLLNAIGGLDHIDSGRIEIDGVRLENRESLKKDRLRVLNIGYIFQDFNLIDNMSVYQNIAMSLKMIGIKDKGCIKERVDYVLEKVNMYRYRNKLAGSLSGGQRQRVGIARAIVKNPNIIIADEPTGNLDSKNTIEIMNIIKAISEERLVILVTHEKNLAEFYASRIIYLEDGKIVADEINEHNRTLDYRIDNKLYLKDFKSKASFKDDNNGITIYADEDENLDLVLVVKNGNIYIKTNKNEKIEVVDDKSGMEFIDGHYQEIERLDYEEAKYDLTKLDNSNLHLKYSSIFKLKDTFKSGFERIKNYTVMKKILLIGFFISAMFVVYSISNIFGTLNIKDSKFIEVDRNYVEIKKSLTTNELDDLSNDVNISYILPGNSKVVLPITNDSIYQFGAYSLNIEGSLVDSSMLDSVIIGEIVKDDYDIVIDKMTLDNVMLQEDATMLGFKTYDDFIGKHIKLENLGVFTIVGVSDTFSPSIYASSKMLNSLIANAIKDEVMSDYPILDYTQSDDLKIVKGRAPVSDYEVLVSEKDSANMPLDKEIEFKINDKKLKVVGYYSPYTNISKFYVNSKTVAYLNLEKSKSSVVYSKDVEKTVEYLKEKKYNAIGTYQSARDKYIKSSEESIVESIIIASILLAISFVEIYLMIRASFLSRIKEIGIFRAIGVKKSDIYKMFLGEIITITTLSSLPGCILMALIVNELSKIKYLKDMFLINGNTILLSIFIIYILNVIVGLLPVVRVVRKSPAAILSRNDVD